MLAFIGCLCWAVADDEKTGDDKKAKPDAEKSWIQQHLSGQSRTVYQYRSSDSETDSDLYEYLFLRGKDLADRRLDLYLSGKLRWDIDGASTSLADDIYAGAEDLDGDVDTRVYQAYGDLHDQSKRFRVRAGRQYVDVADSLHIDGAQAMAFENGVLGGRVFFGRPVSFYSSISGDLAGGFSLVGRPWEGNRTRLTCTWYRDDGVGETDELYVLDGRQTLSESLHSRVRVSAMDNDFQRAGLDMYYLPVDLNADCVAGVHYWDSYDAATRAYSPLYRTVGALNPYTYAYARMSVGAGDWLMVSPAIATRIVNESDRDSGNRDYRHGDLTVTVEPIRSLELSVAGEYWDVSGGDRFFGISGEIRYRHKKLWEVSVGTDYIDYKYERASDISYTLNGGETTISADGTTISLSPDAYTYYLRARWNVNSILSVQVRGELEDNSLEDDNNYLGRFSTVLRF